MVREDLHRRLCVRVRGGLEAQLLNAELPEELIEDSDEVTETEIPVGDDSLNLVELSQVGGVQRLIAEHAVDGEVLGGLELS